MSTTRKFGIITNIQGLSGGICVNSLSYSQTAEIAEARNEKGQITDYAAFSKSKTLSLTGVMDTAKGELATAGSKITIDEKDWIIDTVSKNETNNTFVEVTISAKTADNAIITIIAE